MTIQTQGIAVETDTQLPWKHAVTKAIREIRRQLRVRRQRALIRKSGRTEAMRTRKALRRAAA